MRLKNKPKLLSLIISMTVLLSFSSHAAEIDDGVADMYSRIQNLLIIEDGGTPTETVDKNPVTNYVFIGDSRTVGMQSSVAYDPSDSWSAKVSMGYDWMVSEGIPNVEGAIGNGTAVFILLGINDLGNVYNYISYIDSKASEWSEMGASTYFCAIGPVGNTTVTNQQIESFNSTVSSNLTNAVYVDIYSMLLSNGFGTADGLHYTSDTYNNIYIFLKNFVL